MGDEDGTVQIEYEITEAEPVMLVRKPGQRHVLHRWVIDQGFLIVDFAMPDMRGDQFAEAARRLHPTVPVLFITGYSEPNTLKQERWLLQKPFHAAQLVDVVERAKADHDVRGR